MNTYMASREALFVHNLVHVTAENSGLTPSEYSKTYFWLESVGLKPDNLFLSTNALNPYWYIDEYVHIGLQDLYSDTFEFNKLQNQVKGRKSAQESALSDGKFVEFFEFVSTNFMLDTYMRIFPKLPETERYRVFRFVYVHSDFGFQQLDKQLVSYLLTQHRGDTNVPSNKIDSEGYITIYRGSESLSAPPHLAYSWTILPDIAARFACIRKTMNGAVHKAKVHKNNVVDYINDRREGEILVLPENLISVEDMRCFNFNEELKTTLQYSLALDNYMYLKRFISPALFNNPDGMYGVLHTKRVLLLTLIMTTLAEMPRNDIAVLANTALYHDIGRVGDLHDPLHGVLSLKKMQSLDVSLTGVEESEDFEVMKFIMEFHAKSDKDSHMALRKKASIRDKKRAKHLLTCFKDRNTLDRVRFYDLNLKYLHTEIGQRLILVANQLLMNIQ